jgi:hypothetical protein
MEKRLTTKYTNFTKRIIVILTYRRKQSKGGVLEKASGIMLKTPKQA